MDALHGQTHQANRCAAAKALRPIDVVKDLPCLKHVKNLQTALWLISRTLVVNKICNAKVLKQLHTDVRNHGQT